jgi:hypothetical protein
MTDEQFKELVEALKPADKTRWQGLMDNTLGILIGALTVGFFALLWQLSNDTDKRAAKLEQRTEAIDQAINGVQETIKKEIGDLAGPLAVQASIKEAITNQYKVIQELEQRFDILEARGTTPPNEFKPTVIRTNELTTRLHPFPAVKSDEVIKAVREKEDAIDKRFRQYEQRTVPRN